MTSGAGGALPRGLSVGVVANKSAAGADVKLDANYARTRLVRIINYKFPTISDDDVIDEAEFEQDGTDDADEAATTTDIAARDA